MRNRSRNRNFESTNIRAISASLTSALALAATALLTVQPASAQSLITGTTTTKQCNLAIVSRVGNAQGITCDEKTVRDLARHGHVYEQNELGIASVLAITPGYSTTEALDWFERAARRGYAPAQVNLAAMYINGWGTSVNYGRGLHWLNEAAEQKFPRAYFNLGILYLKGQGVSQDYRKAAEFFRQGAEAGDPSAQSNLGYMYDRGLGITQNSAEAVRWYRRAADQHDAMGENNLADMILRGEGIAQSDPQAFALFQQAAEQGHTGARIKLAYMYAEGKATNKDLETACMWAQAAVTAGDKRGEELLASLHRHMTADQVAKANERALRLKSAPEPAIAAMVR